MEHEGHICFFPFYMRSVLSVKNSLDHACSTFCKKRKFCIAFDFFLALNNIMTTWLYASTLHSINAFGTVYTTNSLSPSENSFDKIVDLLFLTKCSIWKKKKERIWKFITLSRAWKSFYPDSKGKMTKSLVFAKTDGKNVNDTVANKTYNFIAMHTHTHAPLFIYILLTRHKYNLIFRHSWIWTLWTFSTTIWPVLCAT